MEAYIKGIAYYLPEKLLTNEDLVNEFPEWSVEKVTEKIGIKQRHIAAAEETAGDMAVKAAQNLFEEFSVNASSVDFILFCTQSPDYFLPTTACLIQKELCIPTTAGALDFNLGCSGFVYGLSLAKGLIFAGVAKNVLLLTSDTYTKYIHQNDKGNRSIFGDGAAATLVSNSGFAQIGDFVLGTDGSGAENLIIKEGASRHPETSGNTVTDFSGTLCSSSHLYMNGSEIFNFTLKSVPPLLHQTLEKNKLTQSDISMFVFHQADKYMLNTIRKLCQINQEAFYIDIEDLGNTVSSTIPIAIARLMKENKLVQNDNIAILGFGVGYSWGGCILTLKS